MLVLSRKIQESIIIIVDGKEIKVTLLQIKGGKSVRLGIEADKTVRIIRDESQEKDDEDKV